MGGQAFNWDFIPDNLPGKLNTALGSSAGAYRATGAYWGFTNSEVIMIRPIPIRPSHFNQNSIKNDLIRIEWQTYPQKNNADLIKNYLRLDVDYKAVLKKIRKDQHIETALQDQPHVRLLKQDFEQTLLSFILSSNNTILNIKRSARLLAEKLGEKIKIETPTGILTKRLFPRAEELTRAPMGKLLETKIGFRAKFLKAAALHLIKTNLASEILKMNEEDARAALCGIKGVGEKIADCVLLFALSHNNVTPLDVWGQRIAMELYGLNSKLKYKEIRKWFGDYFEGYAGWAAQPLFEYIRKSYPRNNKMISHVAQYV